LIEGVVFVSLVREADDVADGREAIGDGTTDIPLGVDIDTNEVEVEVVDGVDEAICEL